MTPFELLGIPPTATFKEVQVAYKRQAMKHHPDRGGSMERFQELTKAYKTLRKLLEKCPDCGGSGVVRIKFGYAYINEPCTRCWK